MGGGLASTISIRSIQFTCEHGKNPKKDYSKEYNYLSFAWPGLRLNVPLAVSSQWRFSDVVLFVTLKLSNSAPLLSLY